MPLTRITSNVIQDGTIVNADISSSTIIDRAKLQLSSPAGVKTVYLAPRTDGKEGSGSESDPYDTYHANPLEAAKKYDAIIRNRTKCPDNCVIRLLPGDYFTRGVDYYPPNYGNDPAQGLRNKYPWGCSVIGSGISNTKLTAVGDWGAPNSGTEPLSYGSKYNMIIIWCLNTFDPNNTAIPPVPANVSLQGQVISDLTLDGNWQNLRQANLAISGANIIGSKHGTIERVWAKGFGGFLATNFESFVLGVSGQDNAVSVVQNCIVSDEVNGVGETDPYVGAIGAGGYYMGVGSPVYAYRTTRGSGIIRNNVVIKGTSTIKYTSSWCYGAGAARTWLENNVAVNGGNGFYSDTGLTEEAYCTNNYFYEQPIPIHGNFTPSARGVNNVLRWFIDGNKIVLPNPKQANPAFDLSFFGPLRMQYAENVTFTNNIVELNGIPANSISKSGTEVTIVTSYNHGFSNGDQIKITGVVPYVYNNKYTIFGITPNSFKFTVPATYANPDQPFLIQCKKTAYAPSRLDSINSIKWENNFLELGCGGLFVSNMQGEIIGNPSKDFDGSIIADSAYYIKQWDYNQYNPSFWANLTLSLTRNGNTVTGTLTPASGFYYTDTGWANGDTVWIFGASQPEYNGPQKITVTGPLTFTYQITGTPVSPATTTTQIKFALPSGGLNTFNVTGESTNTDNNGRMIGLAFGATYQLQHIDDNNNFVNPSTTSKPWYIPTIKVASGVYNLNSFQPGFFGGNFVLIGDDPKSTILEFPMFYTETPSLKNGWCIFDPKWCAFKNVTLSGRKDASITGTSALIQSPIPNHPNPNYYPVYENVIFVKNNLDRIFNNSIVGILKNCRYSGTGFVGNGSGLHQINDCSFDVDILELPISTSQILHINPVVINSTVKASSYIAISGPIRNSFFEKTGVSGNFNHLDSSAQNIMDSVYLNNFTLLISKNNGEYYNTKIITPQGTTAFFGNGATRPITTSGLAWSTNSNAFYGVTITKLNE